MVSLNRLMLVLSLWLLLSIFGLTFAQKEEQSLTIQGAVSDGADLKPIPNVKVTLEIQYPQANVIKTAFLKSEKTDEQGQYLFKNVLPDLVNKEKYILSFTFIGTNYQNTSYYHYLTKADTDNITKMVFDFKLIKPADELTVSGKVVDVVNKSPLSNMKVQVKLMKVKEYGKGEVNIVNSIECQTDVQGNYQTKVAAEYSPFLDVLSLRDDIVKRIRIQSNSTAYETFDEGHPGMETSKSGQEIKYNINMAQYIHNFFAINTQKEGLLSGVLLDNKAKPIMKAPITLKFGQRQG